MSIGTTTTTPLAAKSHACEVCGLMIEVGERYSRVKGEWEGEWQNWPAHTICLKIYGNEAADGVSQVDWRELVQMTTSAEQLEEFLQRFPPDDDAPEDAAFAMDHFGFIAGRHAARGDALER